MRFIKFIARRENSMKKIIFISVLLAVVMSMTSCLTLLSVLLDSESTEDVTSYVTDNTESNAADAEKIRTEKDAFDASEKLICVTGGAMLQIPDYFSLGNNSQENRRWYYAETAGKTAFIYIFEWPGDNDGKKYSQAEFEEDIENNELQNMYLEMSFSGKDFSNAELLNTEYTNINNTKCCLADYKVDFKNSDTIYKVDCSVFFVYIDRTDTILCLNLGQTDNTDYTYNNDFRKIINSIKILTDEEEENSHTHEYKTTVTKEATCKEEGEQTLTCTVCFRTHTEIIPVSEVHKYSYPTVVKVATCKDTGEKKYVCSTCGYEYTEIIPVKNAHTYSEWKQTKAPTSSTAGSKERKCTVCGKTQTEEVPKLAPVNLPKSTLANNAIKINKQQTVTVPDYCEFTIESINITNDVLPPRRSGVYSHYQAYDETVYIDVCMKYKNLQTEKISADDTLRAYLIFSGIYEYKCSIIVEEDNRSDFTYASITNIAPLSSIYLHVLFNASNVIKSTNGSLTAVFQMDGKSYSIEVRDGMNNTVDTSDGYAQKSSGNITKDEKIAIPGKCEFYIDSISITSTVKPPRASGYYLYYKADEGNKYIDICLYYKNTSNKYINADTVIKSEKLIYNKKYEYTASGCIEEKNRSEFTYLLITDIEPLNYGYIHVMFEVPDEVASNIKGQSVTLTINGSKYTVTI